MLLAVNMIVRNEADHLGAAIESVRDLADEVVVYDTGSTDGTPAIGRAAGATVLQGYWDDDFARARNAALASTAATWVMPLDADERWCGDSGALREALRGGPVDRAYRVLIHNPGAETVGGGYTSSRIQVFPRRGATWVGKVHEYPSGTGIRAVEDLPEEIAVVLHLGYREETVLRRKGERNAELARLQLRDLMGSPADPLELSRVLLDLGRSLFAANERQEAVEAFEAVRALVTEGQEWAEATDFLVRLLLGAGGHDDVVLGLVEQLRSAGVDSRYCDWLAAPALTHTGRVREALTLLRQVDRVVDPGGREHDLGPVLELRSMVAAIAGEREESLRALVDCMSVHGRVQGRGAMLLELWAGSADQLAAELVQGGAHREQILEELDGLGEPGREVVRHLRRRLALGAGSRPARR